MNKPNIPAINNEEAVVEWFLKYDDKIDNFFKDSSNFERIKNEILENLKDNPDSNSLQSFVKKAWEVYEVSLRLIAAAKAENKEIDKNILITELVLSAKMRILGYFLLKKYNIQP